MNDRRPTESAEDLLASVRRAQERAIRGMLVPPWFWWAIGAGMVVVGAVADAGDPTNVTIAAILFAIAVVPLALTMILGPARGARVRSERLGDKGALTIVGFVLLAVAGSLGTAFGLRALGFAFPATAGTLVGAAILVLGGPRLMARLERIMRDNE